MAIVGEDIFCVLRDIFLFTEMNFSKCHFVSRPPQWRDAAQLLRTHAGQGNQDEADPGELLQQPDQPAAGAEGEAQEDGGVLQGAGGRGVGDRGEEEPARRQGDRVLEIEEEQTRSR